MKKIIYTTLFLSILHSCTEPVDNPPLEEPTIIGLWVKSNSDNYNVVKSYSRKEQFEEDKAGLKFSENSDFIFRDKCACPESQYENYFGNYTLLYDSTINVSYKIENETKEKTIKINSITLDTLKVSFK